MEKGQKHAEALLSGSIAIFEYLGAERRSAEAKIELALCYYRQGMFEFARKTLVKTLKDLQPADDLRTLGLIRLGVVERHSGHVTDSLSQLSEALNVIEQSGPLLTGRYHHEFANTLEHLATAENRTDYFEAVTTHFQRAFYEFVAVGHHRYAAVVQNSYGFLLLNRGSFSDAELHLIRARLLFERFDDRIRRAQVEDTLARLYLATQRPELALKAAEKAVASLELNDEEALLAEALTTKGIILCKLHQYGKARGILEGACRVAERCGDPEGAGRALLTLIEEMYNELDKSEQNAIVTRMYELLKDTQLSATRSRLEYYLRLILPTSH
jgi:tetratricopeptide (TPR) repeat protein